jgi:hypothetical protein
VPLTAEHRRNDGRIGSEKKPESKRRATQSCRPPAELTMMAQNLQQGSGDKQDWDLAFEHGYEDGFKKTHSSQ